MELLKKGKNAFVRIASMVQNAYPCRRGCSFRLALTTMAEGLTSLIYSCRRELALCCWAMKMAWRRVLGLFFMRALPEKVLLLLCFSLQSFVAIRGSQKDSFYIHTYTYIVICSTKNGFWGLCPGLGVWGCPKRVIFKGSCSTKSGFWGLCPRSESLGMSKRVMFKGT